MDPKCSRVRSLPGLVPPGLGPRTPDVFTAFSSRAEPHWGRGSLKACGGVGRGEQGSASYGGGGELGSASLEELKAGSTLRTHRPSGFTLLPLSQKKT